MTDDLGARATVGAAGITAAELGEWLNRMDGRLRDIFEMWSTGRRDTGWAAEKLLAEGHIAALMEADPFAKGHLTDAEFAEFMDADRLRGAAPSATGTASEVIDSIDPESGHSDACIDQMYREAGVGADAGDRE